MQGDKPIVPSESQRAAIEAEPRPQLVLAGPGAGKTYCLIERVRHLIEERDIPAERIYAFTFTNKAAEEVASRLSGIGAAAQKVNRSTIHRFCVDVLREFGERVGVPVGFGIADEDYQLSLMWRFESNSRWHKLLLRRFALHRLRGDDLDNGDARKFEAYYAELKKQNLLDFDQLLTKAVELIKDVPDVGAVVRGRFDTILVDEFQDLNRVQYALMRELSRDHKNIFAVGDFDQSIYGWAGADTDVFNAYMNDFDVKPISLVDNRRCPKQVFALARKLVSANTPLLEGLSPIVAEKASPFPVSAVGFADHDAEVAWIIRDIAEQRQKHDVPLGEFALLYRKHEIGDIAEPAMLTAGIPCRLAHGRAVAEDPVVAYAAAALRIIASPDDRVLHEAFLGLVLPKTLMNAVKARAESSGVTPIDILWSRWRDKDDDGRKIRRGLYAVKNFGAMSRRHAGVGDLIEELLARRVGEYETPLEREHLSILDPDAMPEATALAIRLNGAINHDRPVCLPVLNGAGVALKAILHEVGVKEVHVGDRAHKASEQIRDRDASPDGLPLTVFKACQILATRRLARTFKDFVAIDFETTGKSGRFEIVEIGAVRVRDGRIVGEFTSLVKPSVPIEPEATAKAHGLTDADVAHAPTFPEIWPALRDFVGNDMLVAHNGYGFDFPLLRRMADGLPGAQTISTYDSLPLARELVPESRSLESLSAKFGIDIGRAHRALPDAAALAKVFLRLDDMKLSLVRKASLAGSLDHLVVALALSGTHEPGSQAKLFLDLGRSAALGSYSQCLNYYEAGRAELGDDSLPTRDDLIEALGGHERMLRIQAEKSADERYPIAMARIRRLLAGTESSPIKEQIATFLERVALSFADGQQPDHERVNLLTLHSTKGLEFSRVYIVGVEDGQFLGERTTKPELEEARRVLYVGMTRAKDRLVMTRSATRGGKVTGGTQFLDEMGLTAQSP